MQRQDQAIAIASAVGAAALGLAWGVVIGAGRSRTAAVAAQQHYDAVAAHERMVQDLVAAKWAIEAGQLEYGLQILTNALDRAQDAVSRMRTERTGPGRGPGRRH